jgi:hypothetical protein
VLEKVSYVRLSKKSIRLHDFTINNNLCLDYWIIRNVNLLNSFFFVFIVCVYFIFLFVVDIKYLKENFDDILLSLYKLGSRNLFNICFKSLFVCFYFYSFPFNNNIHQGILSDPDIDFIGKINES